MKTFLFVFIFVFTTVLSVPAQSIPLIEDYKLTGTIKDTTGAVISGLNLYVKKADAVRTFVTDINGDYEMSLQPGDYEITVNKTNSKDFRAFIKIQEGNVNPSNLVFVLDPTAVCCTTSAGLAFPKATSLPKPPFPAAARAVRSSGEVVVDVKIDNMGKVVSAVSESGHPLLRKAAEQASRGARFEALDQAGDRVLKLTYVFLSSKEEKEGRTRYSNPFRIEIIV